MFSVWRQRLVLSLSRGISVVSELSKRLAAVPAVRPVAALLGTALVVLASWRAWVGAELTDVPVFAMLAVGVAFLPAVLAVNGAEFWLQASLVDVRLGPVETLRYVSQANVANMLPFPGGPLLRHRVLANRDASQRLAVRAQLFTAVWWLASGLAISGVGLVFAADRWWLGGFAIIGGVALGYAGWSMRVRSAPRADHLRLLALVEVCTVIIGSARLWAIAALLGARLDLPGAATFSFTTPAAAALGIFPSGIGAREALVAGTADVIGADVALLFLAATLERVVSLIAAVPVLLWSLWHPGAELNVPLTGTDEADT